jgi:hypothetical protein
MSDFHPRSDVEILLAQMADGQIEPEDFARRLIDMQVFMPIRDEKHQIAGFQSSTKAQPLLVEDGDGSQVLVTFSAPERAKDFLAAFPGYSGGLLAEMSWIVRRMGAGISLSINPGLEVGFDFDPDMVAMLAALLPEEES